jgi:hypothetical protein
LTAQPEFELKINRAFTDGAQVRRMDTSALASTLVSMQSAATAQQMQLLAVQQANAMAQMAVSLLSDAAEAGKALVASGVGGALDRSA